MQAAAKFKDSLSNLQTTYIDLMLLHYPSCGGALCTQDEEVSAGTWQAAWRELEELVAAGKIRALGELKRPECGPLQGVEAGQMAQEEGDVVLLCRCQ